MKRFFPVILTLMLILTLAITGCGGSKRVGPGDDPGGTFSIAESLVAAAASFPTGTDDSGPGGTVTYPYYMAKYEVTYALWKEVYDWAQSHGYEINEGTCGGTFMTDGTGRDSDPVTWINWYDAVVWCNALTEYYNEKNHANLVCVYQDAADNVIRNSKDSTVQAYLDGLDSMAAVDSSAKGFRLPTGMEWELAARYIGPDQPTVEPLRSAAIPMGGLYWTPGTYASGATSYCDLTHIYDSDAQAATMAAAWYGWNSESSTHPAGQKPANGNALCLYDMSGNVWEWCFETNGANRVCRGGGWDNMVGSMQIGIPNGYTPDYTYSDLGLRPVRTQ